MVAQNIHTHTRVYIHIHIYILTHIHTHTRVYIHIHIYILTHIHTHTCSPVSTDEFAMNLSDAEIGSDAKQEVGVASEDGTSSKQDPSVDIPEAMQLIHSEGGRKVSSQAVSAPKDGYFAFVLLRHLRIRDLRNKVGWYDQEPITQREGALN